MSDSPATDLDLLVPFARDLPTLQLAAAKRDGRGHRARGEPCQDAFALHHDAAKGRAVAAVADGLGSRPLSHFGSQAACDAAVASLAGEAEWDDAALRRAFEAARAAVAEAARRTGRGLGAQDLATTLQLAAVEADGRAVAAMVGDGAIVAVGAGGGDVRLLLEPAPSEYANVVVPLTADEWADSFRTAGMADVATLLLFTDGLTRLLLTRAADRSGESWSPFAPFFGSFLPSLAKDPAKAVERFLASDEVDRAWDDDKALVVVRRA